MPRYLTLELEGKKSIGPAVVNERCPTCRTANLEIDERPFPGSPHPTMKRVLVCSNQCGYVSCPLTDRDVLKIWWPGYYQ